MNEADNVTVPIEGEVTVIATSGTSVATAIPTSWYGRYVTMEASGRAGVIFGDSGVVASLTATSGDTRCWPLAAGAEKHFRLPETGPTHFAAVSEAAGYLYARPSGPKV